MSTLYRHEFTVSGRDTFPVDMLRYDACWPDTSESAIQLLSEDTRAVMLVCWRPKLWVPTIGRWQSFGWHVTKHSVGFKINY